MMSPPPTSVVGLLRHAVMQLVPSYYLSPEQIAIGTPLERLLTFLLVEGGYFHIQSTKPDTIGELILLLETFSCLESYLYW